MTDLPPELLSPVEAALAEGRNADALATLAWLAGQEVRFDEALLRAARRRALLLLATGGDPHRSLAFDGRAVGALAGDLDEPERRAELAEGLTALSEQAAPFPSVADALTRLRADPELAWRALACGLLAEELGEE